jgi:hypothetical protein
MGEGLESKCKKRQCQRSHGRASGKKIYVQLKSGNSYLSTRKADGKEVFDVKNDRHLEYWVNQPVDVYLIIRQTDETRPSAGCT